ncbi:unnamed protein product [Blepharisma stoltei]|uniref:RanBP2-type domain-containing protein n=1 Tax=Blepharisma stoltei TaxID=1481888 RepID=A0AAU9J2D9_9CILI|nr:unnamed protein product [Blepharisma stoltei]
MDKNYRDYSSSVNRYEESTSQESVSLPLRFIADDTLEYSAHTSLLQVLFSVDSFLRAIIEAEFSRSNICEKIKDLAEVYNYSKVPSGTININTLLPWFPNSLKSLNTNPKEILEFLINEFKASRGRFNIDSIFLQQNQSFAIKVLASSFKESDDYSQMVKKEISTLNQSAIVIVEIKWDLNPTSEIIIRIMKSMLSFNNEDYELAGIINYNGCFYSSIIKRNDKWIIFDECSKSEMDWNGVMWTSASRSLYPSLLILKQCYNYDSNSYKISVPDYDKLLKFAQKKDESTRISICELAREYTKPPTPIRENKGILKDSITKASKPVDISIPNSEHPRKINVIDTIPTKDTSDAWKCKKCSNSIQGNIYECPECRIINWDKFYEIKSKQTRNRIPVVSSYTPKEDPQTHNSLFDDPKCSLKKNDGNKQLPPSLSSYVQQESFKEKAKNFYILTDDEPTFRNQTKEEKPRNLSSSARIEANKSVLASTISGTRFQFPKPSTKNEEPSSDFSKYESRRPLSTTNRSLLEKNKSPREGSLTKRVTFAQDEVKKQDQSKSYREDNLPWRESKSLRVESNVGWKCEICGGSNSLMFYLCNVCRKPRPSDYDKKNDEKLISGRRWACEECKSSNSIFSDCCWYCKSPQRSKSVKNLHEDRAEFRASSYMVKERRGRESMYR